MITAYIAVGSNLADPVSQAQQAIEALKTLPNSEFVQASSLYSSTPMGHKISRITSMRLWRSKQI